MCPTVLDHVSLLRRAPVLSRVPRIQTPPHCLGGPWRCHVPRGSKYHLPTLEGSGTITCLTALNPTSLLERASALPRVPRLRTSPPCSWWLRRCHVSRGSEPRLPSREGSGAVMCPAAPFSGGLQYYHVPRGSGPCLPAGSAPTLPHILQSLVGHGPQA
jgi:hypothetical protein